MLRSSHRKASSGISSSEFCGLLIATICTFCCTGFAAASVFKGLGVTTDAAGQSQSVLSKATAADSQQQSVTTPLTTNSTRRLLATTCSGRTYTVKKGDTCWAISQAYGVPVSTILANNPSVNSGCTNLQIGQVLCLGSSSNPTTTCKTVQGYTSARDVDHAGDDIANYGSNTDAAAQACSANANCAGFNSDGWIKTKVAPTKATKGYCLYTKVNVNPPSSDGCPKGWSAAVGTVFDSWPRPGSVECIDYEGCKWAGQFNSIDGGSRPPCKSGAQWLNGGNGDFACRFPESLVKTWSIAATYQLDNALLGHRLEVMIQGKPEKVVTVNVKDVCSDADCSGCCRKNTGNKKWKLIDIEKWPASTLLGFNPYKNDFDINTVSLPSSKGLRPGAPEDSVMPVCYRDLGKAN